MVTQILKRFLGDPQKKQLKTYQSRVDQINAIESEYIALTDEELQAKTQFFKNEIADGKSLDELLVPVFATVREAAKRVLQMRHFDVQLIGGMVLHEGNIAEMKTGEGKTLVATLPAYLNALEGKGVYMVTVNDYLARRDSEWMGKVYAFLGLSVGLIQAGMGSQDRMDAYQCDITFGTNNEYGFDYLRDNLVADVSQLSQSRRHYAIIDEVDSILIDEARTPLIISGPVKDSTEKYLKVAKVVRRLTQETHFTVDEKHKNIVLTEKGIEQIEKNMGLSNMFSVANMDAAHMAVQCLKAIHLFKKDVDYVVKDGDVMIVDEFTGRLMEGRRYSDGLHQAIEAVEGLSIREESQTLASITFQNYFRMFSKLSGMTGTAETEASEFAKIYGLGVVAIPTNKPMVRVDQSDVIYKSKQEKYRAIVKTVNEVSKKGQPVLVGTIAIETSELLSGLLKRQGVAHHVLNAKHHEQEAEIISKAGQKGAVTIATNMAGRGTDIVLGEGVKEAGGLYVIGSERHESRRIDNQLRGRSGRQGDVGETRFFVSLEDDLMRLFGSDRIAKIMETLGMPDNTPIEHKLVTRSIAKAQAKVEKYHFGVRKQILQYDDVMNKQRETIYEKRHRILTKDRLDELYRESVQVSLDSLFREFSIKDLKEGIQKDEFMKQFQTIFPVKNSETMVDSLLKKTDIQKQFEDAVYNFYKYRKSEHPEGVFEELVTKRIFLMTLDRQWMDHLHNMDVLREGIGLRAYGQRDPLIEYKREGFLMFKEFMHSLSQESLMMINRSVVVKQDNPESPISQSPARLQTNRDTAPVKQTSSTSKIGRNDRVVIEKDGVKKDVKWKVAEPMIQQEGWKLQSRL